MIPEIVLAEYVLGIVDAYDLPRIAAEAVTAGTANLELAALVSPARDESSEEIRQWFEHALACAGIELPSRHDAAIVLRWHLAKEVVDGTVRPLRGASRILELYDRVRGLFPDRYHSGDTFGIEAIVDQHYRAEELADLHAAGHVHEADVAWRRAEIEACIVDACRTLTSPDA